MTTQATVNLSYTPQSAEELLAIISALKGSSAAVAVTVNPQSQAEKDTGPWLALYETRTGKRFRLNDQEKSSGKSREEAARERCLSFGWSLDSDAQTESEGEEEESEEEGFTLPEGLAIPSPEDLED